MVNTYKNGENESLRNRFSAYLVAAITNKRIRYIKKKKQQQLTENIQSDLEIKKYLDFDVQYHEFVGEQTAFVLEDWERFHEFMILLESEKLRKELGRLKERECKLLFARIFGELTFEELGEKFNMKPKQAEMAFYYILRKLRKEMEVSGKDDF
ncbi:MAG: sigma-70 family RNA polymerase sigma factor [Lachnospiraceae bacterium]|nr:sigma-70 family RNA polymerase sigma factor [Lachnospiraceae bacterium]